MATISDIAAARAEWEPQGFAVVLCGDCGGDGCPECLHKGFAVTCRRCRGDAPICDCCGVCHAPPKVDCDCAERAAREAA